VKGVGTGLCELCALVDGIYINLFVVMSSFSSFSVFLVFQFF
jgi:hypothetical protein